MYWSQSVYIICKIFISLQMHAIYITYSSFFIIWLLMHSVFCCLRQSLPVLPILSLNCGSFCLNFPSVITDVCASTLSAQHVFFFFYNDCLTCYVHLYYISLHRRKYSILWIYYGLSVLFMDIYGVSVFGDY
jgi:hypothetical protein